VCVSVCAFFFDGYCSTVQGLLDWFEVDLGFTLCVFTHKRIFICPSESLCVCVRVCARADE